MTCRCPAGGAAAGRTGNNVVTRDAPQIRRMLKWLLLALLAMLVSYYSFRGYLVPELLIGFANSFTC